MFMQSYGFFLFYSCWRVLDVTSHLQFVVDEEVVDELVLLGRGLGLDHDGEGGPIHYSETLDFGNKSPPTMFVRFTLKMSPQICWICPKYALKGGVGKERCNQVQCKRQKEFLHQCSGWGCV